MVVQIQTPLSDEVVLGLKAGDEVRITGVLYTARDAAHEKLKRLLLEGKELPFDIRGQIIYYAGPTPAKPGRAVGACGPTTSRRMDPYVPLLLAHGLKGMIGKGRRSASVTQAIAQHHAVYMVTIGGAAALLSRHIRKAEVVAYPEMGPEAIYKLTIEEFPAIVATDAYGNDVFAQVSNSWRRP
ncbi:MAG TPA: TRZ/ATZ family protein [Firmicutes bacterium]|nr:TRZ/ATZ family protein [Candidatus Fermentithermobacillaceae bacterium]